MTPERTSETPQLQRYSIRIESAEDGETWYEEEEDPRGQWVRDKDVAALEREREGLREHVRSALRELAGGKPSDAEMHLQLALAGEAGKNQDEQ